MSDESVGPQPPVVTPPVLAPGVYAISVGCTFSDSDGTVVAFDAGTLTVS